MLPYPIQIVHRSYIIEGWLRPGSIGQCEGEEENGYNANGADPVSHSSVSPQFSFFLEMSKEHKRMWREEIVWGQFRDIMEDKYGIIHGAKTNNVNPC